MEDGFLGKILVGDNAKDIPCGQVSFLILSSQAQRYLLQALKFYVHDWTQLYVFFNKILMIDVILEWQLWSILLRKIIRREGLSIF